VVPRVIAGVLAFALASGCGIGSKKLQRSQELAIEKIARTAMQSRHIPGMAIGVGRNGTILYERGFGMRARGWTATGSTVFPIGSITKQFTAACVMQLVDRGRISLDAPVARYVENAPHARQVTVRELLLQTSGLADYTLQPALQNAVGANKLNALTSRRLLDLIESKPLSFKPGTRFEYSNTNYVVAGMIVARVSGQSYETYLKAQILDPQRLNHTQYLKTSVAEGNDASHGYKVVHGRAVELPVFTMSWAGAAGALASDAPDLIAWDDAFFHGSVVSRRSVETMTTPSAQAKDYAMGWAVDRVDGARMIWHNGGLPGAHAMNAVFPQSGYEIVVLTNLFSATPEDIAKQIFGALNGRSQS
jgi:D-alanyl-D-alanine carboxypeptidase